jgi:hypothetical protein
LRYEWRKYAQVSLTYPIGQEVFAVIRDSKASARAHRFIADHRRNHRARQHHEPSRSKCRDAPLRSAPSVTPRDAPDGVRSRENTVTREKSVGRTQLRAGRKKKIID